MLGRMIDWNYVLDFINEPRLAKFLSNEETWEFSFFVFDYAT